MKRFIDSKISKITFLFFVALVIFVVPHSVSAQAQLLANLAGGLGETLTDGLGWISVQVLLRFTTLLTLLGGAILNFVVDYTVVHMADNVTGSNGVINKAWGTIRDVANMGFIFILLYASIQMILGVGKNIQRLIVNVIIVAVLINFSLFLTKVVIDVSNVIAITFYGAMAPGALEDGFNQGIANSLMEPLKVSTIMSAAETADLGGTTLIIVGIMGSVVALIAAFVFFAVAIMFIIRFVVLIFIMVLSPIAFMAYILPELEPQAKKWKEALIGQSFFAPIYFLLTWVVIVIANGLFTDGGSIGEAFSGVLVEENGQMVAKPSKAGITAFMNFSIIIAMLIASLVIAKDWSNKAGSGVKGLTKWATGAAGGMTLGMAGRVGRNTFGRAGALVGDSERLKESAAKGGFGGAASRLTLAAGRKTSKSSFDLRSSPLGSQLDAGKAQKGGFEQVLKDKRKNEADFVKSLSPSDMLTTDAERALEKAKGTPEEAVLQARVDELKGVKKEDLEKREKDELARDSEIKKAKELEEEVKNKESQVDTTEIEELKEERKKELLSMREKLEEAKKRAEERSSEIKSKYRNERGDIQPVKSVGEKRKESRVEAIERSPTYKAAGVVQQVTDKVPGTRWVPNAIKMKNRAAVAEIRKGKKSVKDQIQDMLKEDGEKPKPAEGEAKEGEGKEETKE